jgi:hypothetical protein
MFIGFEILNRENCFRFTRTLKGSYILGDSDIRIVFIIL